MPVEGEGTQRHERAVPEEVDDGGGVVALVECGETDEAGSDHVVLAERPRERGRSLLARDEQARARPAQAAIGIVERVPERRGRQSAGVPVEHGAGELAGPCLVGGQGLDQRQRTERYLRRVDAVVDGRLGPVPHLEDPVGAAHQQEGQRPDVGRAGEHNDGGLPDVAAGMHRQEPGGDGGATGALGQGGDVLRSDGVPVGEIVGNGQRAAPVLVVEAAVPRPGDAGEPALDIGERRGGAVEIRFRPTEPGGGRRRASSSPESHRHRMPRPVGGAGGFQ